MKLREIVLASALVEVRSAVGEYLSESITEYFSDVISSLKAKKTDVDFERLARIVTTLKVLANPTYRQAMTKDDVEFNPNSMKELSQFLADIKRDGRDPRYVEIAVNAITHLAPTMLKKEKEDLAVFISGDDSEKQKAIQDLTAFVGKADQMFKAARAKSSQAIAPTA